jgi:hypothetical protein
MAGGQPKWAIITKVLFPSKKSDCIILPSVHGSVISGKRFVFLKEDKSVSRKMRSKQ